MRRVRAPPRLRRLAGARLRRDRRPLRRRAGLRVRARARREDVVSAGRVVVVGAGVASLAAATALRRDAPAVEVLVLERNPRVGGLVETERTGEGFVVEHGADCLMTTK